MIFDFDLFFQSFFGIHDLEHILDLLLRENLSKSRIPSNVSNFPDCRNILNRSLNYCHHLVFLLFPVVELYFPERRFFNLFFWSKLFSRFVLRSCFFILLWFFNLRLSFFKLCFLLSQNFFRIFRVFFGSSQVNHQSVQEVSQNLISTFFVVWVVFTTEESSQFCF